MLLLFLRGLFLVVLGSMLAVTAWAGLQCPLFALPREVYAHPWFIATMFDAYWGFITFFVWVCLKQTAWSARLAWFVAIMLLGNIAMASFCLRELFRVPRDGRLADVLTAARPGASRLGLALAGVGLVVVGAALRG
ncbi:MAG: DUF1475 family protein [Verrucomicrobia bacterium]|nr:DUF1475 family protein [Verrucomicrobiota bacterium]